MKKILISLSLFLFICINLLAQQNHFIYIQADNKQPFYIKLNDKVYSSSATGYIILSKLVENNYNLSIGFPKNEWPEQKLNLAVQKSDLGYMLKNFDDKGWGLVDMNTFQILYANVPSAVANPSNTIAKKNDIKEKTIESQREEPKPVDITATPKNVVKVEELKEKSTELKKDEPKATEIATKDDIKKLFTSKSNSNIEIVYLVKNNTTFDTVKISIPVEENKTQIIPVVQPVKVAEPKNNNEAVPITKPVQQPIAEQPKPQLNKEADIVKNVSKNNCTSVANEDDYKKLRKKMAAAESDNEMLFKAHQIFQKQCFTTEQIKTLSFLFLNEEGKYKFFDTAYPYVSDTENFTKLVTLLSDEYYIKRFNAMLKN